MKSFEEIGLDSELLSAIKELGFENPMPIQEEVIPHLIGEDRPDIIGLAQTGTGKTAAFGLPIIQNTDSSKNKIQFLILSPTRELCLQIFDDLTSYAKNKPNVKIAAVFGGSSIDRQIEKIRKGVHIISATAGRLVDLINRGIVDLSNLQTIVLDEADEMLNMGFRDELEMILNEVPEDVQTLLFSATMQKGVDDIARKFLTKPIEITIGKKNSGADNVEHLCYMVQARDRYFALKRIVDYNPAIYGIIFCRTRKETQEIADSLIRDGYNADSLHGDLSQGQRDMVMNKFRIKHLQLLVATDIAARGLDVDDLTHIINYNLPEELETYTHRSGRTGRTGKKGVSIIITNLKEKSKIQHIEKSLGKKFNMASVPLGGEICEKQLFYQIDRMEKVEVDYTLIDPLLPDIFKKLEWLDREELIKKFVSVEFNRFLDYYKKMPDLNSPADGKGGRKVEPQEGFTRIFINLGKMDNLLPQTLMKMISQATGISNIEIGKIDILKTFSFFEVDSTYSKQVMDSMEGMEVKGRVVNLELAESQGRDNTRDRKSGRGGRSERSGGFRSREDRPSRDRGSRDRSPRRESSGERRSSERKSYGSRGSFGDSDRAPRGERSSREGRSSSSSSRSESSGERGGYRSRDDRAPREGRSSERKPYGSRSSFGESSSRSRSGDGDSSSRSRSGGDRDKKFGRSSDRKSRDRKSDGDSYGAKKSEKKVWINEEYSDKSKRGFGQVKKRKSKD
ncbi:MAG: DEAD/DEAH box helicase [Ignavibacteriaceae bacterium]|jgi:ATP-dependent RNA helicase DeaD|nr:DEAD/DEAH box helicase [Ignavibacteriaceae bacterium]